MIEWLGNGLASLLAMAVVLSFVGFLIYAAFELLACFFEVRTEYLKGIHLLITAAVAVWWGIEVAPELWLAFKLGVGFAKLEVILKCVLMFVALLFQRMLFLLIVAAADAQVKSLGAISEITKSLASIAETLGVDTDADSLAVNIEHIAQHIGNGDDDSGGDYGEADDDGGGWDPSGDGDPAGVS